MCTPMLSNPAAGGKIGGSGMRPAAAPLAPPGPGTENPHMSDRDLPAAPIPPTERQRAVDRLCAHFAADHIGTSEFERRLDLAYAARTSSELVALERDLPELASDEVPAPTSAPAASTRVDSTLPVSEHAFVLSVMGGSERKGHWTPPRKLTVLALMGGALLDFRDARFATQEVDVTIVAVMGGAEVVVPPGVRVEWNGVAIMGGVGGSEPSRPTDPAAPRIRINGLVLMGGVEIKERLPGENDREARKRIKAERKAKRRLSAPDSEG